MSSLAVVAKAGGRRVIRRLGRRGQSNASGGSVHRCIRGAAIAACLALFSTGCWSDEPPRAPAPEGPTPRSTTDPAGELRTPPMLQPFDIGGDFVLTDHAGAEFSLADHRGEILLMFFGYTSCPDFCPRTLSLIARAIEHLGDRSDEVTTLFVSVDPERDTPEKLAQYLEYFDIRAIGLTGSKEQIDIVVPMYAARYEVEAGTNVAALTFAHTTYIYLIDQQGRVRYTFMHNDTPEFIAAGIKLLLKAAVSSELVVPGLSSSRAIGSCMPIGSCGALDRTGATPST